MEKIRENGTDEAYRFIRNTLQLNAKVLGIVTAFLCGLIIFMATNWLVIKGGDPVGPHLQLLGQYFVGYSVTFKGSIIGFFYGALLGGFCGALFGWIYNRIVIWRDSSKGILQK